MHFQTKNSQITMYFQSKNTKNDAFSKYNFLLEDFLGHGVFIRSFGFYYGVM